MAKSDKKTKKLKAPKSGKKAKAKGAPTVSPLAPASFPENPAGRRCAASTARGRRPLCRAHRSYARRYRTGEHTGRGVHALRHTVGGGARLPGQAGEPVRQAAARFRGLVNSGNANTFTGARGVRDVDVIADATAQAVGVPPEHVFTSSTGVIGEPLDASKITDTLHDLVAGLTPTISRRRRARS
jgi:glutamate N-acetyltransferase/amino-acid N-acetyltransferase